MRMKKMIPRILRILLGLFLYSMGTYLGIQANVGLGAWEAFGTGVSAHTGISYGNVTILTGLVILGLDVLLGEKIGLATILNTLLIGTFVDVLNGMNLVPKLTGFMPGVLLLLGGQVLICLGVYFYVGVGYGAGPRDSLMIALGKRMPRVPIGVVRGAVEGSALLAGLLLGAKAGIGTVISVFGISFLMQSTFRLLHFDVKAVQHESVMQTLRKQVVTTRRIL